MKNMLKLLSSLFVAIFCLIYSSSDLYGACVNCEMEKAKCDNKSLSDYIQCINDIEKESKALYDSLLKTAMDQLDSIDKNASKSRDNLVKECNKLDNIGAKYICIAGAYAAYNTTMGAAYTAYGLAVAAIAGQITAFEYGKFAMCTLLKENDLNLCNNEYNKCNSNQSFQGICLKCDKGRVVPDDSHPCDDNDPCTTNDQCSNGKCSGSKIKKPSPSSPTDCF